MWRSQETIWGRKVNVKFVRVDPYRLGNRIPQAFQNLSDLDVRCHREKFYMGFYTFWGARKNLVANICIFGQIFGGSKYG